MLYYILLIATVIFSVTAIRIGYVNGPSKKLQLLTKAVNNDCVTLGKLTCQTRTYSNGQDILNQEYLYMVDGKPYYVTYSQKMYGNSDRGNIETFSSEYLLNIFHPTRLFYYQKDNPAKSVVKDEIFLPAELFHKVKTPKTNRYRNVARDWDMDDYIDLRK